MIKSPLNYMGGKYKLLPQIIPIFPRKINTFVDVFSGGGNVGINIESKKLILNDNLIYLIDLYKYILSHSKTEILQYVESRISTLDLSKTNLDGYLKLREQYNEYRHPLDLFVLTAYSFNHQIRFNNAHKFNVPFGKEKSSFNTNMKKNLLDFIDCLHGKNIECFDLSFELLNYDILDKDDFVYLDPPYLITTGTYNDGKRGFKGWGEKEEYDLLNLLNNLNQRKIRFALSNVLEHKGRKNNILLEWISEQKYKVHELNYHYKNSSYNTQRKGEVISREVLITNY